jgi:hypothetical protein
MALLAGCSSSSSHGALGPIDGGGDATIDAALDGAGAADAEIDSPNEVPGECVFSSNFWYCGPGYGTYPTCPGADYPLLGTTCDFDSGFCMGCMAGAAEIFGCVLGSYTIGNSGHPVGTECNH